MQDHSGERLARARKCTSPQVTGLGLLAVSQVGFRGITR
jgi:hypothetical protein